MSNLHVDLNDARGPLHAAPLELSRLEAHWLLAYADGTTEREDQKQGSIRFARPGAKRLYLCKPTLEPFYQIELWDDLGQPCRPIFYRRRTAGAAGPTTLVATCFGRGRETAGTVDGQLWALLGGQVVDCPRVLIDRTMLELQVTALL